VAHAARAPHLFGFLGSFANLPSAYPKCNDRNHNKEESRSQGNNPIKEKIQQLWVDGVVMDCRFCKNYDPRGRQGGYCNLLSVSVQGKWAACSCYLDNFPKVSIPEDEKSIANLVLV
jgi:hypothetical protein